MDELDEATKDGSALETLIKAREEGLIRHIGITGHGAYAPTVFLEALDRFDFDSVLFPVNFIQFADDRYREDAVQLMNKCKKNTVGVMMIKSICTGPWGDKEQTFHTWYEPFSDPGKIQDAVNFALSQEATGICSAGDTRLLPYVLDACAHFSPLSETDQEEMIRNAHLYEPLFKRETT
jgi:predicted aldo/keto reductase-like oxidoreductase